MRKFAFLLRDLIACFIALFAGLLFSDKEFVTAMSSLFGDLGLDVERTVLVVALLVVLIAGFIGGMLGRRIGGAVLGGALFFSLGYLRTFILTEIQPSYDPGHNLEPLNQGALLHTALTMLSLSVLAAFIGAAVGLALSHVLFNPLIRGLKALWRRYYNEKYLTRINTLKMAVLKSRYDQANKRPHPLLGWLACLAMIAFIVLASGSANLFFLSPDDGLHQEPVVGKNLHGTVLQKTLVSRSMKGQIRSFLIYLPPSYYLPQSRKRYYPSLYLLHGVPGHDVDMLNGGKAGTSSNTLISQNKIHEMILVMPDGNGRAGIPSEWGNSVDGQEMFENFVTYDLVTYIDQHYRTIHSAKDRGIGGLSMGGFGGMNIAIHHPNIFGTVISLGGYFVAGGPIWDHNPAYRRANSPLYTLPGNHAAYHLHIFLGASVQDVVYYKDTVQFAKELGKLHIPYKLDIQKGGHSWRAWRIQLYNSFLWLHWG